MLEEHLHVTGLAVSCKVRNVTDPMFWEDFQFEGKSAEELRDAAVRKNAELSKLARDKVAENPLRYGSFSERVREIIERFSRGQIDIAELLAEQERLMKEFMDGESAHERSRLSEKSYGIYRILEAFKPSTATASSAAEDRGAGYSATTAADDAGGLSASSGSPSRSTRSMPRMSPHRLGGKTRTGSRRSCVRRYGGLSIRSGFRIGSRSPRAWKSSR